MTEEWSEEIKQASQFESDLISHVNSNSKTFDKILAWDIEQHCETSHDGMKRVFYKLGENFQLFSIDADKRWCQTLPNSKWRRVHLCVDQLPVRNVRCLKINLSKKLTELGTIKLVLPLLELLSRFTCTIDYLHKTRIHRNDVMYRTHYSRFLQAFQCHPKQKRITGEPEKKMQLYERFIYIVDRAHRRVRMKIYLGGKLPSNFSPLEGESRCQFILRQDERYLW